MVIKMRQQKLTLYQPTKYQIKVPGALDKKWLDWDRGTTIAVENDKNGNPITVLTLTVDQAALQGLLRHLYSLGLPLISAIWIDHMKK